MREGGEGEGERRRWRRMAFKRFNLPLPPSSSSSSSEAIIMHECVGSQNRMRSSEAALESLAMTSMMANNDGLESCS